MGSEGTSGLQRLGSRGPGPCPTAPSSPCSTLPDSPPDSGSEAYSPQQVNGESSGHRPPPLGFGRVVGAALSGREGAGKGGGQRPPNRPRLSLVKYSPALAIVSPLAGGGPGPASENLSRPAMPPACPPAPSWTHPSVVSGRPGKAVGTARVQAWLTSWAHLPWWGRVPGVLRPPGGQKQKDLGQPSPHSPERGQEFCLSYQKHFWNASWGTKGAGGLAPGSPLEGLPDGEGLLQDCAGGPPRLLPEAQRRIGTERGQGRTPGSQACGEGAS